MHQQTFSVFVLITSLPNKGPTVAQGVGTRLTLGIGVNGSNPPSATNRFSVNKHQILGTGSFLQMVRKNILNFGQAASVQRD